ncbi:hypothetical protein HDU90_006582 [Geranomyces variabilis]|nr:hypothetical protein HDU90_006582 [Geranomyces variabilis]
MSSLVSNHCPLTVAWSNNPAATGGHATTFIPPRTKSTPTYILHQREKRRHQDAAEEAGLLRAAAAAASNTSTLKRVSGASTAYGTAASVSGKNSIYLNFITDYEASFVSEIHIEDIKGKEEEEIINNCTNLSLQETDLGISDCPDFLPEFESESVERSRFNFSHLNNKSLPALPSHPPSVSTHRLSIPSAPKCDDNEMAPMSSTLRYYDLPEREGVLWYRGHSDTKWTRVWCVVRDKTIWVYASRQDILPMDQISLVPGISVLPMDSTPVDVSALPFTPPPSRTSHGFTVTTPLRRTRADVRQQHNHFAATDRLDMLLWMAQMIRTSQGAAQVPRTLVPIVSPAPSLPRRATVGGGSTEKVGRGRGRKEAMVISAPLRALVRPAVNTSVRGVNTWPGQSSSVSSSGYSMSSTSNPSSPKRLTLGTIARKIRELRGEA